MRKIAYLISTLQKTGPTNILVGTITHLDRTHYKPIVITLSPETHANNSWSPELHKQGVAIISLNLKRYQLMQLPIKLKQTIDSIQPDIIHSHCFRSTVLSAIVLKNFKRVATIHCDYTQDFPMAYGKLMGKSMTSLFTYALKQINKRICCSRALSDLLQKKFPTISFDYVNNGVDTDIFYPVSEKKRIRQQLGLPLDKIILIWAGAFIPRKDPMCLVHAIQKVSNKNAFFLFCGKGPLLAKAKEQLKNFENVLFTGYTDQVALYLQASDCYISTSLSEGLPCSILEAEACNLPLILSDIFQHRYITQNWPLILFYNCKDSLQLQQQIVAFLCKQNIRLKNACLSSWCEKLSTSTMSLHYQKQYEALFIS